jgi:hypothetical protein
MGCSISYEVEVSKDRFSPGDEMLSLVVYSQQKRIQNWVKLSYPV